MLVALLISTLFALNLIDAVATLDAVSNGAIEVNPLMRYFLDIGTVEFFLAKMVLVLGGCAILYVARNSSWCVPSLVVLNFFYVAVCLYHLILLGNHA